MSRNKNPQDGFTLVELSIVLVIIGLIVGGVLVGQDLIRAAAVRAQISQIERYNTAANAFYGKYGYLPGDLTQATALQFGFAARGQNAGQGDGNGVIEGVAATKSGVSTSVLREAGEIVTYTGAVPDVVAYLQAETELTRATLVRILKESNRLTEFLVNPQKFMDAVAAILKQQLHKLMIDGIKYERIAGEEFNMMLFEEKEIVGYLNNRLEVNKSVYDAVVYDSEVEREFAEKLDKRDDIKLFVKLPVWFKIETPLGTYNPDWAIVKEDDTVVYLVRETKGTKNFEKLRNIEAEKIRCGRKHFETLKVDFDVVTSAGEVK